MFGSEVHPRRAAVVLLVGAMFGVAGCQSAKSSSTGRPEPSAPASSTTASSVPPRAAARRARVLLIGDSILDQEGSAAAFLLRQAGVDARSIGVWGSGLIGSDQYDYGKTKLSGYWLHRAAIEITSFDPDAVGVYMNHSYWPPYPHDAAGKVIDDLSSATGQAMIGQQARALITILRSRHAKVFFITPAPAATTGNPDLAASNPIWRGYLPVLRQMHVTIAETARPLERADGLRAETETSCHGTPERVRPPNDVHLTRFGAGLAGTALATFVAHFVHANLRGDAAPGDDLAALVPTRDGRGYWLVGCDGSVYHFGDARPLTGLRAALMRHGGAVTAVATPSGAGLWLVAPDGTIAAAGDAPPITFARRPAAPIVAAAARPGGNGLWAVSASGVVSTAGSARAYAASAGVEARGVIVAIAATHDGRGYWLVASDGTVLPFGDAHLAGSLAGSKLTAPIVGIAATFDGRGYWLVGADGSVFAFGDAQFRGAGTWTRPPGPRGDSMAVPGPTIGIAAAAGASQGYWTFGTTGRVAALGAAGRFGGDNNLALETQ